MSYDVVVKTLDELMVFLNEKGCMEVVTRDLKKRFEEFANVFFDTEHIEEEVKKLVERGNTSDSLKVLNGRLTDLGEIVSIGNVASWISAGASIINIGVTVAGFVIMAKKLDKLDAKVTQVAAGVKELKNMSLEFNVSDTFEDLEMKTKDLCSKIAEGKPVTPEEIEDLINRQSRFLNRIAALVGNIPMDSCLNIIYTLLPLFSALIVFYYENYYEYHNGLYANHSKWMQTLNTIASKEFTDNTIDHCMLDKEMHNGQVSLTLKHQNELNAAVREDIEDTLALIQALGGTDEYRKYKVQITNAARVQAEAEIKPVLHEIMPEQAEAVFAACAEKAFAVA